MAIRAWIENAERRTARAHRLQGAIAVLVGILGTLLLAGKINPVLGVLAVLILGGAFAAHGKATFGTIQAWLTGTPEYLRQAQQGLLTNTLTATGNSLGTALASATDFEVFTTVSASTGTALFGTIGAGTGPCQPADTMIKVNHGAQTLSVYPFASTGKIANGSQGAAFSVGANKTATFFLVSASPDVWAASVSA